MAVFLLRQPFFMTKTEAKIEAEAEVKVKEIKLCFQGRSCLDAKD